MADGRTGVKLTLPCIGGQRECAPHLAGRTGASPLAWRLRTPQAGRGPPVTRGCGVAGHGRAGDANTEGGTYADGAAHRDHVRAGGRAAHDHRGAGRAVRGVDAHDRARSRRAGTGRRAPRHVPGRGRRCGRRRGIQGAPRPLEHARRGGAVRRARRVAQHRRRPGGHAAHRAGSSPGPTWARRSRREAPSYSTCPRGSTTPSCRRSSPCCSTPCASAAARASSTSRGRGEACASWSRRGSSTSNRAGICTPSAASERRFACSSSSASPPSTCWKKRAKRARPRRSPFPPLTRRCCCRPTRTRPGTFLAEFDYDAADEFVLAETIDARFLERGADEAVGVARFRTDDEAWVRRLAGFLGDLAHLREP